MQKLKKLTLLGATGSIGDSTLEILGQYGDHFDLVAIAGKSSYEKLAKIAKRFKVKKVAIFDEDAYFKAKKSGLFAKDTEFFCGLEGLNTISSLEEVDAVVVAIVGTTGLTPTLEALKKGKDILLASKEVLVLAGKFVMELATKNGCKILPLDSEHNAIFQCLDGKPAESVDKIIVTASGGPFREYSLDEMKTVALESALKHPNWDMGPKVTIDSASMANKGLEMIEAHWLFDMQSEKIEVTVHPQSIVHSMVQFVDGSILAQLSPPKMTFAIQHMLFYPERAQSVSKPLDFTQPHALEFHPPDLQKFPCLRLAREALEAGNCAPAVFNASNEVAVEAFIERKLSFLQIAEVIDKTLQTVRNTDPQEVADVLAADNEARRIASEFIKSL